jgi:hypothetical protein
MRSAVAVRHAAIVAAASALTAAAAACSGTPITPAVGSGPAVGSDPSGSSGSAAPALQACSLLMEADVQAVAASFKHIKITVVSHMQSNDPPVNKCGFNQKGVFRSEGLTNTESGDRWAELAVVSNGADFAFEPSGNVAISGLGDGAYWERGTHQVVVRVGRNVLQVSDEVPVDPGAFPDITVAYRQAAQALATKIVSHL